MKAKDGVAGGEISLPLVLLGSDKVILALNKLVAFPIKVPVYHKHAR